jgi:quercetin dioxygenase-like cupin family protein
MHRPLSLILLPAALATLSGCLAGGPTGNMTFPAGEVQHVVRSDEIQWQACPPGLPPGCEITILEGNPKQADLFSVRFNSTQLLYLPAHTHPKDERVTILKGSVAVAFGKDAKRADAKEFGAGDYYVNARNAVHSVWVEKGTILQITGIGPWRVDYVDE